MNIQLLSLPGDRAAASALLNRCGVRLTPQLDELLGIFEGDELVACAGRRSNVIQCAAVSPEVRGERLLNMLVSQLFTTIRNIGYPGAFVFTKPATAALFMSLGFFLLAQTEEAALLYSQRDGVARWAGTLPQFGNSAPNAGHEQAPQNESSGQPYPIGCIVMNANPFTNGHRYLVERAASKCRGLYVLVVEHEGSQFSFHDRLNLVQAGTADLPNICVCPGGPFIISLATFPSYFLKRADAAAFVHADLDAHVFGEKIAPALHISARFVGNEPLDPMTNAYNEALARTLPPCGVALEIIDRLTQTGEPVSASRVRALFNAGNLDAIAPLVPASTHRYLCGLAAARQGKSAARPGTEESRP